MLGVVRRNPQYRRLWMAQVVSRLGDWLNRVAVLALIGDLAGGEAAVGLGLVFGIEMALRLRPSTLLGTLAGSAADRIPRRAIMIGADVLRAGVVLSLLTIQDASQLPLLYALLFLQMAIGIFFEAAQTAAIPGTVARADLHHAHALHSATWSLMLTIGALLGGLFVGWVGVRGVFLLDAGTYLVSALFLTGLRLAPVPAHPHPLRLRDVVMLRDLRRGLAHARERGVVPIVFTKASWGAAGGFLVILGIAGQTRFNDAAGAADPAAAVASAGFATGLLYAARGFGTAIGPILGRRMLGVTDLALRLQISLGFLVAAVGYALFGLAGWLPLAMFLVAFAHLGGSALWVSSTVFWQRHVDDAFRGRIYAMEFMGMTLAASLGGLLAGVIYDLTGSLETTVFSVCGMVVVSGVSWTLRARSVGPIGSPAASTPPAESAPTSAPLLAPRRS